MIVLVLNDPSFSNESESPMMSGRIWSVLTLVALGLLTQSSTVRADIVQADDVIIQSSLCVGFDCINGEDFGFDTIRLKENNVQIKFEDTSAGEFPGTDWILVANDSNSGGLNKFVIQDATAGTTPFTVRGGARTDALYVHSTGRIGVGTSSPSLDLHVSTGNTPGLRFDQSDASGFTPQVWDVAGNEANFFVRDVTGGSRLPFRIAPGAPTNALSLSSEGNAGFGLQTAQAQVHVRKSAIAGAELIARFDVSDDANGRLLINNASASGGIFHPRIQGITTSQATALTLEGVIVEDVGANPVFSFTGTRSGGGAIGARPIAVFRNNVAVVARIAANGDVTATSFNPSSSREIKKDIAELDSTRAAAALQELNPVEFVYKDDPSGEQRVGFIAEEVPELVANQDRKSVPIMDVVALVTRVVKDQQQTIDSQRQSLADQQKTIHELTERLNALEAALRDRQSPDQ